jgi:dTDP-4-dehydrorhamnose 3,5-epimerase
VAQLEVEPLQPEGVLQITPARFADARGYFCETYNRDAFLQAGIDCTFVQDNQSLSHAKGVVRGLHFQIPPYAQAKLVRVLRGSIYDVAVDLRRASPTCGKSVAVTLSAKRGNQLFIPAGFAHGFCTLEPETEVLYKVDAPYSREHERGLLWNDAGIGIAWPVEEREAIVIERDKAHPALRDFQDFF